VSSTRKPVKSWKTHVLHAKASLAVIVAIAVVRGMIAAAVVAVVAVVAVAVMMATRAAAMTALPTCRTSLKTKLFSIEMMRPAGEIMAGLLF
jgi:hypothetical protein